MRMSIATFDESPLTYINIMCAKKNKTVLKSLQQTVYGKCMTNNTGLCVEHTNQSLRKKYNISERRKTRSLDILRYAERLQYT